MDIPEPLLRRAKAATSLRGMKLRDFVIEALRLALRQTEGRVAEQLPAVAQEDRQRPADDCIFPLIRDADGAALRDLTPERVHAILEEEEVERQLESSESG